MPQMTRPIGYNPTQLPTGMPGEFDDEQAEIQRRRQQMLALMEKPIGGADTGLAGGIVNFLQGVGNQYERGQLDTQEKSLAQRRAEAADAWLAQMPQDRPAVPEQVGTGPVAPPPGTPGVEVPPTLAPAATGDPTVLPDSNNMLPQPPEFVPNRAGSPMVPVGVKDMAAWAGRGAGFSPMHAKVAEKALETAITAPEKKALADAAAAERKDRADADRAERQRAAIATEAQRRDAAAAAEAQRRDAADQSASLRRDIAAANVQARYDLAKTIGAQAAGTFVEAGGTLDGNIVLRNSKQPDQIVQMVDGKPLPYTGPIVRPGEEKDVKAAMAAANEAAQSERMAALVKADPATFSPGANIGASISNFFGGAGKEKLTGLTPDQLELRGIIGRDFAETTKKLYGASFTASEQARANGFTPQSQDSAELVVQKLEGAAKFSRQMAEKYGTKVQQAAATRLGDGVPPEPAAPAADTGWGPVRKR
jgi:hypothetical protein